MYNHIVIIGIGTLGGFLSEAIANLDSVNEITIIDNDIVEEHNLKNSIYRKKDIGNLKTDSLYEILKFKNEDIKINKINSEFIENKSNIPKSDLVIDCRDVIYDRGAIIDIRLSISSRYVILDCRKNVSYNEHTEGGYLTELTKNDLRNATFIVSVLMYNGEISNLIKSQIIKKVDIDYLKKTRKKPVDIICENYNNSDNKFINLTENLYPILDMNKDNDLNMFVGSETFPINSQIIPKGLFKSTNDVVNNFVSFVNLPLAFNNYIISFYKRGGNSYVELIPETGAA